MFKTVCITLLACTIVTGCGYFKTSKSSRRSGGALSSSGPGGGSDQTSRASAAQCEAKPSSRTLLQRLTKTEYDNTLRQILGISSTPSLNLPSDAESSDGFDNNAAALTMAPDYFSGYMDAAAIAVREALAINGTPLLNCALGAQAGAPQDDACVRRLMSSFVLKANRRPATPDELNRLSAIATAVRASGGSFADGISTATQAVLVSPDFLYRAYGVGSPENTRTLISGYEMATRLAHFLWNSPPDQRLLDLAANGTLNTPEVLTAEYTRMVADPKFDLFSENFSGQWLSTRKIMSSIDVSRPANLFPEFNQELRSDMKTETDLFFKNIIKQGASAYDLLNGDYSYVNANLAKLYGIPNVTGTEFRKVPLAGTQRKGVLTHASILTSNAHGVETSPTLRGYWVLKKVTCNPPPPVPAGLVVTPLNDQVTPGKTLKELMAMHRENPTCAGCHARMDPIGLGFERFSAIGKLRTADAYGNAVDPSGVLPGDKTFADHLGMIDHIAAEDDFPVCITKKVVSYAVGRAMTGDDQCGLQLLADEHVQKDGKFSDLILGVILSDFFRKQ